MKNFRITTAIVALGLGLAGTAYSAGTTEPSQLEMSNGQIKRINKGSGKLTIKHGEIKTLDMPPMTMVFRVADKAMLDTVKKGDKILFHVIDKDGAMVITKIKPTQ